MFVFITTVEKGSQGCHTRQYHRNRRYIAYFPLFHICPVILIVFKHIVEPEQLPLITEHTDTVNAFIA